MRELTLFIATVTALVAFAGLSSQAVARNLPDDWSQYQHDASRSGRISAKGPIWPTPVPGWPVDCDRCRFGPAVADVQYSSTIRQRRVVFVGGDNPSTLYGFSYEGQDLPGEWPVSVAPHNPSPNDGGVPRSPIVAKSDRGGTNIFTSREDTVGRPDDDGLDGLIHGLSLDGQTLRGDWPFDVLNHKVFAFPTLVEGSVVSTRPGQTLYVASDYSRPFEPLAGGFLHALLPDGSYSYGWPVQIGDTWLFSGPAVDRDGSVYISSGFRNDGDPYFALQGFTASGWPKRGWPHRFPGNLDFWTSGPAVGGDGTIYVGGTDSPQGDLTADRSYYYAFEPNGTVKPGWPAEVEGRIVGTPSIAGDNTTYISVQRTFADGIRQASVYAFDPDGNQVPTWPVSFTVDGGEPDALPGAITSIALDGKDNVYFGHVNEVLGYDPQARPLPGWPVRLSPSPEFSYIWGPAIAGDGTMYFTHSVPGGDNRVYAVRSQRRTGLDRPSGAGTRGGNSGTRLKTRRGRGVSDVPARIRRASKQGNILGIPIEPGKNPLSRGYGASISGRR